MTYVIEIRELPYKEWNLVCVSWFVQDNNSDCSLSTTYLSQCAKYEIWSLGSHTSSEFEQRISMESLIRLRLLPLAGSVLSSSVSSSLPSSLSDVPVSIASPSSFHLTYSSSAESIYPRHQPSSSLFKSSSGSRPFVNAFSDLTQAVPSSQLSYRPSRYLGTASNLLPTQK